MVDAYPTSHEIIELPNTHDSESKISENSRKQYTGRSLKKYSIEDDINKIFDAIEIGSSCKKERHITDALSKSAMKRPMRVGPSKVSGIGISESVSLKQALRGLCISQASEMAAVKKRMSRPGVTKAGALKRLYRAVVTEAGQPHDEGKANLVEILFLPEKTSLLNFSDTTRESGVVHELSKPKLEPFSFVTTTFNEKLPALDEIVPLKGVSSVKAGHSKEQVNKLQSVSNRGFGSSKESLKTQNFVKKKFVSKTTRLEKNHSQHNEKSNNNHDSYTSELIFQTPKSIREKGCKEIDKMKMEITKADEKSSSNEKGETSQSSKSSSIGEYSSTTSYSEKSHFSGYMPHMSKDLRCQAISCVKTHNGNLGLRHFKLLKKLGGGDIGNVYLCELIGTRCLFAVKIMDKDFLVSKKKMVRAQTEKEILEILDHPFLPTLYANFTTNKFSCLVMEYCPGGDLHVLRQKQLTKSFSEPAARFYVAEILLALEYLHMLGIVYRDLKPENILVREDGHIMLTDFDLSLRSASNPILLNPSSPITGPDEKISSPFSNSSCVCLTPGFLSTCKTRKLAADVIPLPQLLVEPTTARSNSFVGTHEYLAPEIIKGEGHGSAVDWWTFGIFLYELLYGKTPFKGSTNEETISNIVSMSLHFPECSMVSSHARDLIGKLLKKEPENRLGSVMGATDIKQHPFFEGLNWALIRCEIPPEIQKVFDLGNVLPDVGYGNKIRKEALESEYGGDVVFEMF